MALSFYRRYIESIITIVIAHYNVTRRSLAIFWMQARHFIVLVSQSLFEKLLQRYLPPCIVRTLLTWYPHQKVTVKWNTCDSSKFPVANGVCQGGVLSPIYIDDLITELEKTGVGCFWNHYFGSAVCYADDVDFLPPLLLLFDT